MLCKSSLVGLKSPLDLHFLGFERGSPAHRCLPEKLMNSQTAHKVKRAHWGESLKLLVAAHGHLVETLVDCQKGGAIWVQIAQFTTTNAVDLFTKDENCQKPD